MFRPKEKQRTAESGAMRRDGDAMPNRTPSQSITAGQDRFVDYLKKRFGQRKRMMGAQ